MAHFSDPALLPGPDGWQFAPEGAAVHATTETGVIADVHLGYEWTRGAGGDSVPAHSLGETLAKLDRLLARVPLRRLIVAGDLVESRRPCRRTAGDVRRLSDWLEARGVELIALAGNHDPRRVPPAPETCSVGDWTIGHGHRPLEGERTLSGHLHPVLRVRGLTAPSFLVGRSTIILPAFTPNAAGWNLLAEPAPQSWRGAALRCLAGVEDTLLDFGPLDSLRARLAGMQH